MEALGTAALLQSAAHRLFRAATQFPRSPYTWWKEEDQQVRRAEKQQYTSPVRRVNPRCGRRRQAQEGVSHAAFIDRRCCASLGCSPYTFSTGCSEGHVFKNGSVLSPAGSSVRYAGPARRCLCWSVNACDYLHRCWILPGCHPSVNYSMA